MRKSRFTEEQIAMALRQGEAGTPVEEICRKLGISQGTYFRWKKQFGGLGVPELRELRQLRDENRRLKGLVADLTLDKTMLQEALRKNGDARAASRGGCVGRDGLPGFAAEELSSFWPAPLDDSLPESTAPRGGVAAATEGARRGSCPGRLPAVARLPDSGRLAGQPQAGVSAVPRRGLVAAAAQATAETQRSSPDRSAASGSCERALGH